MTWWVQSTYSQPIYFIDTFLILSSHLRLGLPRISFLQAFLAKLSNNQRKKNSYVPYTKYEFYSSVSLILLIMIVLLFIATSQCFSVRGQWRALKWTVIGLIFDTTQKIKRLITRSRDCFRISMWDKRPAHADSSWLTAYYRLFLEKMIVALLVMNFLASVEVEGSFCSAKAPHWTLSWARLDLTPHPRSLGSVQYYCIGLLSGNALDSYSRGKITWFESDPGYRLFSPRLLSLVSLGERRESTVNSPQPPPLKSWLIRRPWSSSNLIHTPSLGC
jgi:hypothetical protein